MGLTRRAARRARYSGPVRRVWPTAEDDARARIALVEPLIDREWYVQRYPELADFPHDPAWHYLEWGAAQDWDPHPLFSTSWYREQYPHWVDEGPSPLESFFEHPDRNPHPVFDSEWYLRRYPDVAAAGVVPLVHYLTFGAREGRWPHPLFDPEYYLDMQEPSLREDPGAIANPLLHSLARTDRARSSHPLFDCAWYLSRYPDVAEDPSVEPLTHYLWWGAAADRLPNPGFSPFRYAADIPRATWRRGNGLLDLDHRATGEFLTEAKARLRYESEAELQRFLGSGQTLRISGDDAVVTAIIPVFNQANLLLSCLQGLVACGEPMRVVIIDNASSDAVPDLLRRVDGVDVISNVRNVGFVDGVNQGFEAVTTPYGLLLNSDAVIRPGSLRHGLAALRGETGVAAVGARVVLPNGLLQEAGSLIDRDSFAVGYLRNRPVSEGAAMYRRDVDFCSGVALLLDMAVVRDLDGFATEFRPAYGEEVDLALRMWERGWRTVYEPGFVVDHLEYGSAKSVEHLELMEEHRALLRERHGSWLADRPRLTDGPSEALARWPQRDRVPGLIAVDDRVPLPRNGAGDPRSVEVLRAFDDLGVAVMLVPNDIRQELDFAEVWQTLPRRLEIRPEGGLASLPHLVAQSPGRFQSLYVSRRHNLAEVVRLREQFPHLAGLRVVYDSEAITSLRVHPGQGVSEEQIAADLRAEMELARQADTVIAVTEAEAEVFREAGCVDVAVLSHAVAVTAHSDAPPPGHQVVFVGRLTDPESPNVDSMRWFIDNVLDRVINQVPDARLLVVGEISDEVRNDLAREHVTVAGPVADLTLVLAESRVFVAPTRFAAGLPLKVLTTAASGRPVVATSTLADQVRWDVGSELLVADEPADFAAAVTELLTDDELWLRVRDAAANRVAEEYSQDAFRSRLAQIMDLPPPN